jgi:hypothetical protein
MKKHHFSAVFRHFFVTDPFWKRFFGMWALPARSKVRTVPRNLQNRGFLMGKSGFWGDFTYKNGVFTYKMGVFTYENGVFGRFTYKNGVFTYKKGVLGRFYMVFYYVFYSKFGVFWCNFDPKKGVLNNKKKWVFRASLYHFIFKSPQKLKFTIKKNPFYM